ARECRWGCGSRRSSRLRRYAPSAGSSGRVSWVRRSSRRRTGGRMPPVGEKDGSEIAVVGMAGRFPGANSVDELWENLRNGVESVSPISREGWAAEINVHPSFLDRPDLVPWRPRVEGVELFDAAFFGYTPREAQVLDPQQRLFLECAWEALENAGYHREGFPGWLGVAAGVSQSSYLMNYVQWDRELNQLMGALKIGLGNMNDALA